MIPFPFNENRFSFFVADHLLVGQLCTNPKSGRSLLSCLKVTQCSTSEIRDALYQSKLWQQNHCQHPQNANLDGSTLEGTAQCIRRSFGGGGVEGHIMPPHILKVGLKVKIKAYLNVLKSVVIPWCNQVASGRPWVWQQDAVPAHKSKETQAWFQKECYDFVPFSYWPPSSPAGLLRLVICREHDLTQHQSQPDRNHPLSIRRALAGTCGKGMLPVPDLYWGWRLYYIIKLPELIFSIKVLK